MHEHEHSEHKSHEMKNGNGSHKNHGGHEHHDHQSHHAHMVADFRKRFWISLIITIPILLLSPMIQNFLGLRESLRFPGDMYILLHSLQSYFSMEDIHSLKGFTTS